MEPTRAPHHRKMLQAGDGRHCPRCGVVLADEHGQPYPHARRHNLKACRRIAKSFGETVQACERKTQCL